MAIVGAHVTLFTPEAEALRAQFRDIFGFPYVDAHEGWLIFALPPAELGIHPAEGPTFESGVRHQLALMCDDITKTISELRARGVRIDGEPTTESYGITIMMTMAGGVEVLLYEPHHTTAIGLSR